ncbi:MAG: hypothetical protein JWR42_2900 [Marmoricola sp.]|nr:hypothetical protein [Marmoricola sp.]
MSAQVVLLSGAAGGIGSATARRLLERGAHVVLADLDGPAVEAVAAELGDRASALTLDVTDPAACADAVAAVVAEHGRLDVVWSNAGTSDFGPVETMPGEAWRRIVEVNLVGAYNLVHAALPEILRQRGYVALTASWASFAHSPGHSAYAASKAGLEALANSLRSEVAHQGVRVGVFHPGWISTPMVLDKVEHNPAFAALLESLPAPLRAITSVDDLADVLAEAIARRSEKVIHPRRGWLLHGIRPLLSTRLLSAGGRRVAPEIRRRAQRPRPTPPDAGRSTTS